MLEMPNCLIYEEKLFSFSSTFPLLSTRVMMFLDIYTRGVVIIITYVEISQ